MAARPTTRYVLLSTFALFFVIYFIFLQPRGPDSPATRAPGHLTDTKNTIPSNLALDDDVLKGNVVMPKLANETAKYVLACLASSEARRVELTVSLHIQSGARSVYLEVLPHDDGTIPKRAYTGGTRGPAVFCVFIRTTLSLVRSLCAVASEAGANITYCIAGNVHRIFRDISKNIRRKFRRATQHRDGAASSTTK